MECDKDWNKDRIVNAMAKMSAVQTDMMMLLDRGSATKGVRDRMVELLKSAASDISKIRA